METGLLPDGIFVSPAFLARMADGMTEERSVDWHGTEEQERLMLKVPKTEPRSVEEDLDVDAAIRVQSEVDFSAMTFLTPRVQSLAQSGSACWSSEIGGFGRSVPAAVPFPSPHPTFCAPEAMSSSAVDQRPLQAERSASRQAIPANLRSRFRRKGISERIRMLAKLMPWDRKMNTSTMLEETRKYVKFLEAQVTVLQCMPVESCFSYPLPSSFGPSASALRGLERLTRQQLLHVLVRSPLVQDKLCSRGLCVFSVEQVILMRQAAERKKLLLQQKQQQQQFEPQMFLDSGSTSTISE